MPRVTMLPGHIATACGEPLRGWLGARTTLLPGRHEPPCFLSMNPCRATECPPIIHPAIFQPIFSSSTFFFVSSDGLCLFFRSRHFLATALVMTLGRET